MKKKLLDGIPLDATLRSYDAAAVSDGTGVDTGPETLVQQHLRDEVDINTIVRRFGLTQSMPFGPAQGVYGDFTGLSDFESMEERVASVRERFMRLPAELRDRFRNSPAELARYVSQQTQEDFVKEFETPVEPAPPVVS